MEKEITGMMVYYYAVCKRKLWYFYNEIKMEDGNEDVMIGKSIDEDCYCRNDKHINIDNIINIDFIKKDNILNEIKKSRKIEEASILQVKYYLYYLKSRGVFNITGLIDYPLLKQNVKVELLWEDEMNISNICNEIKSITSKKVPPQLIKKAICKKCAYYELCYI